MRSVLEEPKERKVKKRWWDSMLIKNALKIKFLVLISLNFNEENF